MLVVNNRAILHFLKINMSPPYEARALIYLHVSSPHPVAIRCKVIHLHIARYKQRHAHNARRAMNGVTLRFGDYAIFSQLQLFWPGHTFRFCSRKKAGLRRLARCSRTPVAARSHLSRRIDVPWSPGLGRRWYCHMADTGSEGLAVKPRLHIRTNPRQTRRGFFPSTKLSSRRHASGRLTKSFFFSSISFYWCLDRSPLRFGRYVSGRHSLNSCRAA